MFQEMSEGIKLIAILSLILLTLSLVVPKVMKKVDK